jgi:hypothetical protein
MVEQWSSKPFVMVRFLLSLIFINSSSLKIFDSTMHISFFFKNTSHEIFFKKSPNCCLFFTDLSKNTKVTSFNNYSIPSLTFFRSYIFLTQFKNFNKKKKPKLVRTTFNLLKQHYSYFKQTHHSLFLLSYFFYNLINFLKKFSNKFKKLIIFHYSRYFNDFEFFLKKEKQSNFKKYTSKFNLNKQNTNFLRCPNNLNIGYFPSLIPNPLNILNFTKIHSSLFLNPLLTKYLWTRHKIYNDWTDTSASIFFFNFKLFNLNSSKSLFFTKNHKYFIKRRVFQTINVSKFNNNLITWNHGILIRFLEYCTGKKIYIKSFAFLQNNLSVTEQTTCLLWAQKTKSFKKTIGNGIFILEAIQIFYIAFKLRDPYFLITWMTSTLQKISFWKFKFFFFFIKYIFKYFFWSHFKILKIKGIKIKISGKISVAGNARTRTIVTKIGNVGYSTFSNKILSSFDLVRSFTGVMGLRIWIIF